MSVTLTNGEVLVAKRAVDQLLQVVMPAQTALRIRRAARDLSITAGEIEQEYQKITDRYSVRGPDGQIQFEMAGGQRQPVIGDRKALQQARTELLDESTVEVEPLSIATLKIAEDIRPSILMDMSDWLTGDTAIVGEVRHVRVGDFVYTANGIHALADKPMSFENATKLWRIYTQLRTASKIATDRRKELLEKYARRNAEGEMVYLDRVTNRVDVADEFYAEEAELLDSVSRVEGIGEAWLTSLEEQHKLPGNVVAALLDLIVELPPTEGEEHEDTTG